MPTKVKRQAELVSRRARGAKFYLRLQGIRKASDPARALFVASPRRRSSPLHHWTTPQHRGHAIRDRENTHVMWARNDAFVPLPT